MDRREILENDRQKKLVFRLGRQYTPEHEQHPDMETCKKIRSDANPYTDADYFEERRRKHRTKPPNDPKQMGTYVRTAMKHMVI